MAKAVAECTCRKCGEMFKKVNAYCRNRSDADHWEAWASGYYDLCSSCWKLEQEEEKARKNAEAAKAAGEMNLPDLTGSDKQVKWATTLRNSFIEKAQKSISQGMMAARVDAKNGGDNVSRINEAIELTQKVLEFALRTKTEAKFWIDNRNSSYEVVMFHLNDEMEKTESIISSGTDIKVEDIAEVVKPEEQTHDGVVSIEVSGTAVVASFCRDEDFRKLIKPMGYVWRNHRWEKSINDFTGSAEDRLIELGNTLLRNGYAVSVIDDTIIDRMVAGRYEPECRRWVKAKTKEGLFMVIFEYDKSLSASLKKIPTTHWNSSYGCYTVSTLRWQELQDFADLNGFRFSDAAAQLLQAARKRTMSVVPGAPEENKDLTEAERLAIVLSDTASVIPDLVDADD